MDLSDGKIRVALLIDIQECDAAKAWVSVMASDGTSFHWVQHAELFYDEDRHQQPNGHVGLYVSDFCGLANLPTALCRPSAAELAAGISRFVFLPSRGMQKSND